MDKFLQKFGSGKTLIGIAIFITLSVVCLLTGTDVPYFQEPKSWIEFFTMFGTAAGGIITGIGVVDKVAKARTAELREQLAKKSAVVAAVQDVFPDKK